MDGEYRAESFFLKKLHCGINVGDDRGLEEISLVADGVAAGEDLRAPRVGILDEAGDRGHAPLVRERAHARIGLEARTDLDLERLLAQPVDQRVGNRAYRHDYGDRHASLTSGPVAGGGDVVCRELEIRVG